MTGHLGTTSLWPNFRIFHGPRHRQLERRSESMGHSQFAHRYAGSQSFQPNSCGGSDRGKAGKLSLHHYRISPRKALWLHPPPAPPPENLSSVFVSCRHSTSIPESFRNYTRSMRRRPEFIPGCFHVGSNLAAAECSRPISGGWLSLIIGWGEKFILALWPKRVRANAGGHGPTTVRPQPKRPLEIHHNPPCRFFSKMSDAVARNLS